MNIIIPLAGSGNRFKEDGYTVPKPLIPVLGEPMIFHVIRSLQLQEDDVIYIVYSKELESHQFQSIVYKEFHDLHIHFIPIQHPTRGAAETVLCGLQSIQNLWHKTILVDGDTFYGSDILGFSRQDNRFAEGNIIFHFKDEGNQPIYSYIDIAKDGYVMNIKEKERISDCACTGAYVFRNGELLKTHCERVLNTDSRSAGEFYISDIYRSMLQGGEKVGAIHIEDFSCVGTPTQLKQYCMENDVFAGTKRFCFDLDGTLCTYPKVAGDYSTVEPIKRNVARLKYLKSLRHTIIINTSRGMGSNEQNAGAALASRYKDVFAFLEKHEIPYDEIYFGKPQADFYIDDLSVHSYSDIEKATGFYDDKIEPRHFNKIEYTRNGTVIKTTGNIGEINWYDNISIYKGNNSIGELIKHFPNVYSIDGFKIEMEKINGIPFSYLFINGSLTKSDVDLVLSTLDKIHNVSFAPSTIDIYANYSQKLLDRHSNFKYQKIDGQADEYYMFLLNKLNKYQSQDLGIAGIIHGDPVFSNVFLCPNRHIKFIDMRGKVGDVCTIYGDTMYDFAKVYQSLTGYDYILCDAEIKGEYNIDLLRFFEKKFTEKFGEKQLDWLKIITASLYFSLIPLHTDLEKQKKYFGLMKSLLNGKD